MEMIAAGQHTEFDIVHGFMYINDDEDKSSRRLRDRNELARLVSQQKRELS